MKLICRTEKKKGKWYGLYECPSCNEFVELRIDTVVTHKKRFDYPKLCRKCKFKEVAKKRIRHGATVNSKEARLYRMWKNIKSRSNPKWQDTYYKAYKGITICEEWKNSYKVFREWALNNGYRDDLTIDRIDPKKGYYPENCRFITLSENSALAKNPNKKLFKEKHLTKILKMREAGMTYEAIGKYFGVTRNAVSHFIVKNCSSKSP